MAFTFNGIGTKYYGSTDKGPDGSYVATEWFVVVYVPLVPLRSLRMLPVSGGTNLLVYASQRFHVQQVPLHWRQVRNTYLTVLGGIAALVLFSWLSGK